MFPNSNIMQSLYKNQKSLFKDFQDFLSRKQHIPENRLPYYLRWVSRYHEYCSRHNIDGDLSDAIAAYLQDLAKHYEDLQVQEAREAVRHVLTIEVVGLDSAVRARKPRRLPVVLSRQEVFRIFDQMQGTACLMVGIIYGSRLRLQECL
jgi:site-specific recombinase XerD